MESSPILHNDLIPKSEHIYAQSRIQANTLFSFVSKLEFLINSVKQAALYPRFCIEDVSYLKIEKFNQIAIPMKCFCDINIHKLGIHLECYGYYGLGFSKDWGIRNKIQPVKYINPESELCADFSVAFNSALKSDSNDKSPEQELMENYLLHELMYCKPYDGNIKNRNTNELSSKCFEDECEWRFVPDVTQAGYNQVYYKQDMLNDAVLMDYSNSMEGISTLALKFEYRDIKYIIIKEEAELDIIYAEIDKLNLENKKKNKLYSRIMIWDSIKGDF